MLRRRSGVRVGDSGEWTGLERSGGWGEVGEAFPVPKVAPSAKLERACREELRDGL